MKIAIIGDPVPELKVRMDTTLLVAAECNRRGHEVHYTTPDKVFLQSQDPAAVWQKLSYLGQGGDLPQDSLGPPAVRPVTDFDLVLMRQDPPVDEKYTTLTHILDFSKVCVLNSPADVRSFNEKMSVLRLPGLSPPSLISIDPDVIQRFVRESPHGCVLKPMNLFNGRGVIRLDHKNPDLSELIRSGTEDYRKFVIIQHFVADVEKGDKRVFLVDGKPIGRMNRVPAPGEWRANIHLGASPRPFELSPRDLEIIDGVATLLADYDLPIACIDIIGAFLTEINVTSPSGIPEINRIYGDGHERPIVDYLEARSWGGKRRDRPLEIG
ncbi:MAG: hypothetical protein J0H65_17230 [Rhizobiales bacterium]|nr:hypothetical protein [Hyphomicrobiales bacterium]